MWRTCIRLFSILKHGENSWSRGAECEETYRPLGVQQDVGELQHQSVGRLVVRLLQGVGQQLRARRLNDHLTVTSSTGDHTHTHRDNRSHCAFINQSTLTMNIFHKMRKSGKSEKIQEVLASKGKIQPSYLSYVGPKRRKVLFSVYRSHNQLIPPLWKTQTGRWDVPIWRCAYITYTEATVGTEYTFMKLFTPQLHWGCWRKTPNYNLNPAEKDVRWGVYLGSLHFPIKCHCHAWAFVYF